ncbi:primase-helicase family protein [Chryseobacterium sp.]|uniref:primase-helicase family protein n=1 Tax=Chryseobacterium sp. TaxID=1871047 RepID=UPI002FC8382B
MENQHDNPNNEIIFWEKVYKTHGKYTFTINPSDLKHFMENRGIRKYILNGVEKTIRYKRGIVNEITNQQAFNLGLEHIKTFGDKILENAYYRQAEILLLSKKAILGSLREIKLPPLRDTQDKAFLFFQNSYVEIRSDGTIQIKENTMIPSLRGFIWEKSIINRKYLQNNETSVFELFLRTVTNNEDHYKSVITAIGYLLHKYKNPSNTKVVVISDENTEVENSANGGTGKGIIVTALEQFLNMAKQNGKNIDFSDNRFAFQNVDLDTDVLYLDDVKNGFDFEQLFTVITGDMTVEKKNKPSFNIPFKLSPKIVITTNYQIKGDSSSHARRKFLIFLNNYYSDIYRPIDEFKQLFFIDWSDTEWNKFDTFVINCIKEYLVNGLQEYKQNEELRLKKIRAVMPNHLFEALEDKCTELNTFYWLKDFGISNLKLIHLYAEYKGNALYSRKIKGITQFAFKRK